MLESTLRLFNTTAVPPGNKPIDPRADPKWFFLLQSRQIDFLEMLGPKSSESIYQQHDFNTRVNWVIGISLELQGREHLKIIILTYLILVPRFWDYTWTNWCDLVEGGCPAAEGDNDHLIEEARILWDPDLQERIREEILLQQQLPEIYVSKWCL